MLTLFTKNHIFTFSISFIYSQNLFRIMQKLWNKISLTGVDLHLSEFEIKSVTFINRICAIIGFFVITSIIINLVLGTFTFIPALAISLGLISLNYILNHYQLFFLSKPLVLLTIISLLTYMSFNGGAGSGLEFYFLSLIALPVIIFQTRKPAYFFQLLCLTALAFQKFFIDPNIPTTEADQFVINVFFVVNSFYSGLLIALAIRFFKNTNNKFEQELIDKNKIIEDKNAQLQALNKGLDSFSYSVSHDLQAPLRTIAGFADLVQKDYKEKLDGEGNRMLDLIKKNAIRMKNLIDDLLSLSKSEKKEIELDVVNMRELAEDVTQELRAVIEQNKAEIKINAMPEARVDVVLMKQVLINLLSNALKYASKKEEPKIEIGSFKEGKDTVYFVRDNGIGIDMQYADKIFNAFQRLHGASEYEGTGIGLAIVQSIVKRHGGRIWVESTLNEGSTFYFTLPNP